MQRILVVFTFSYCLAAFPQDNACDNVLIYASHDTSQQSYDTSVTKSIYSSECSGETMRENADTEIGVEAVVKAIPIKFNFGGSSNKERLNQFCKTVHDYYSSDLHAQESDSTVVREAVAAWQECVHAKKIQFLPTVDNTQVLLGLRRKTGDEVKVTGVKVNPTLLKCTVPGKSGPMAADLSTRQTLTGEDWTISCDRLPEANGDVTEYPAATLSVVTTADHFVLKIPAVAEQPRRWSGDFEDQLKSQQVQISTLNAEKLDCATSSATSDLRGYPVADAPIPNIADRDQYFVTGGGCVVTNSDQPPHRAPPFGHNPPITVSYPIDKGWRCAGGDPPNLPVPFQLTATVIYCKLKK